MLTRLYVGNSHASHQGSVYTILFLYCENTDVSLESSDICTYIYRIVTYMVHIHTYIVGYDMHTYVYTYHSTLDSWCIPLFCRGCVERPELHESHHFFRRVAKMGFAVRILPHSLQYYTIRTRSTLISNNHGETNASMSYSIELVRGLSGTLAERVGGSADDSECRPFDAWLLPHARGGWAAVQSIHTGRFVFGRSSKRIRNEGCETAAFIHH